MICFSFLDKSQKNYWLPKLFDLLYENMLDITPDDQPYEAQKTQWLEEVSPALDKAPRQMILCLEDGNLVGYIQYYIRDQMLMVEEFQLKRIYQRTLLFYRFVQYLISVMPRNLQRIEAYAHKRNGYSVFLMGKLGMRQCEDACTSPFIHMAGNLANIRLWSRR